MSPKMYDHIRLSMPQPFTDPAARDAFIQRFGLFVRDDKRGVLHNRGYNTLEQNRGIYMRLATAPKQKTEVLTLSFSLHKFYNSITNKAYQNYNDFTFAAANKAYNIMLELLNIDLSQAQVKKYELGINILCPLNPQSYMAELSHITINGKDARIEEDIHQREYKQYSTHKTRDKRSVYIFYDKTFEARSKIKDPAKRVAIPDNIMRIEKDNTRPSEKIYFNQLFAPCFQRLALQEFRRRFVDGLHYKATSIKTKGVTSKQIEVSQQLRKHGLEASQQHYKDLYKQGFISAKQYRYFNELLQIIAVGDIKIKQDISKTAKEAKCMIMSKLNGM